MRKDSPLAAKKEILFSELVGLPLIMPSQTSNNNQLTTFFADTMEKPHIIATYNLIYNAELMVESKMGYALCIDELINTAGDHPLTFRPLVPRLWSNVYLCTKKYQVFSKATKLFLAVWRKISATYDANSKVIVTFLLPSNSFNSLADLSVIFPSLVYAHELEP